MDFEITGVVWNILPNETLSAVMNKDLDRVGGFTYTPQELAFAEEIRKTPTESPDVAIGSQEKIRPSRPAGSLVNRSRRCPLERVAGVDDRGVRSRRGGAQLAGERQRRRNDWS